VEATAASIGSRVEFITELAVGDHEDVGDP